MLNLFGFSFIGVGLFSAVVGSSAVIPLLIGVVMLALGYIRR